ncbi:MAG: vWA domain-containing protein, partial [Longimicrobiales bacterium]
TEPPALRAALLLVAALALGLAAAGPRWGFEAVEARSRSSSIVLALDASNSMLATDLEPNRLQRERLFASRLLRELSGDRLGLIVFAGRGYVLAPLTVDHSALQLYLDALDPQILSAGGTAISSGLRQATDLARGDESGAERAVVLVTDGEALEERGLVLEAAERAAAAGVVVHTVGVGTAAGARIPDVDPGTGAIRGFIRDVDGSIVVSRLDEALLRDVAGITGGTYVHLGEAGATERLLDRLRSLERAPTDAAGRRLEPKDRTGWFVGIALALLVLDAWLARRERPTHGAAQPRPATA